MKQYKAFRKVLLGLFLCAMAWGLGYGQNTQLSGTMTGPDGSPFNGYLKLALEQQGASISPTCAPSGAPSQVLPIVTITVKVTNGALVSPPKVWGADCLQPSGIPYNITVQDTYGNKLYTDEWLIQGSNFNIGTAVSVYNPNITYSPGYNPGYAPTAVSNTSLVLNIAAGLSFCNNSTMAYSGGSLNMTSSTTNYVYISPSSGCVPGAKTVGYVQGDIPIAIVTTNGSGITNIVDTRTMFSQGGTGGGGSGDVWQTDNLSGGCNGTNVTFNLSQTPNPSSSLNLIENGQTFAATYDYTLSSTTITLINGTVCNTGDVLIGNYRTVTVSNWSNFEVPGGSVNGTNPTFTFAHVPTGGLQLLRNGIFQVVNVDFTISGNVVTFVPGAIPQTGDLLFASYTF